MSPVALPTALEGWRPPDRGVLFVISGPSGVGKSTLIHRAMARIPGLAFSVSATTRAPRPGEIDGVHYRFVGNDAFDDLVRKNALLEHAQVYDRRYGTLRGPTEAAVAAGTSLILDIDVQGSAQIRRHFADAVHLMIVPPRLSVLEERLRARGTEDEETIRRRMAQVGEQIRAIGSFDYVVVNAEIETAQAVFDGIVLAELSRRARRESIVADVLGQL